MSSFTKQSDSLPPPNNNHQVAVASTAAVTSATTSPRRKEKSHSKSASKGGGSGGGGGSVKSMKNNVLDDGSLYDDPSALDERDPNYDSEEETGREYIPVISERIASYDPELRSSVKTASMRLPEYKKKIEKYFLDFFLSGDLFEWKRCITELNCPEYSYELVKRAVSMSLDRSERERELISQLFSSCYPDILSASMIGKGFERLFELTDELEKDAPAARESITIFLARCVVDEVLPPSFLSDIVVCNLGGDVVEQAKFLLNREHAGAHLERIWGPGDGRPVREMKVAVDLLIQEYFVSGDVDEASRCIRELNSHFFHHEIVKRGITRVLDKSEETKDQLLRLFVHLSQAEVISLEQFTKGFSRVFQNMQDLSLDIPNALSLANAFKVRAIAAKVLLPEEAGLLGEDDASENDLKSEL